MYVRVGVRNNSFFWPNFSHFPQLILSFAQLSPACCSTLLFVFNNFLHKVYNNYILSIGRLIKRFQESSSTLLISQEIYLFSQKTEAIPVILHIITFCSSKYCLRYTDMEIVVYPGILVHRKYFSWQKIFGKIINLNCKNDYNVR